MFAKMPEPPYYAVIFTSKRSLNNEGYEEMDDLIYQLVVKEKGYIGHEHSRNADGFGVHVSYWKTMEDICKWKSHEQHSTAKGLGKEKWYESYSVKIAKVEKQY